MRERRSVPEGRGTQERRGMPKDGGCRRGEHAGGMNLGKGDSGRAAR
ncbi:MAG TPA: hypothetical protein IAA05_01080 [Candidatus Blautia excrementipullorum]|nr:hypothetical protein [Candidatus Blautia excrementipullorum]